MFKRRKPWLVGLLMVVATVVYFVTRGPEAPMPNRPGTFSFAVLGDAPYYVWEELQYNLVLQTLDINDLSWVIHVGDIFWKPCSDDHYRKYLDKFNRLRHPLIYTPGDNEWTDCWESQAGGFGPRERLDRIRQILFSNPTQSLGAKTLPIVSQSGTEQFSEFVENARWIHAGIVFATVNIPGSKNAMESFPGRTADDDSAAKRRTDAAAAWIREAFDEARNSSAPAVVISFHANAALDDSADDPFRQAFEPFIGALEEGADRFSGRVLLAHGDGHEYTIDHPLVRRTTGQRLANVTRLQVPGSPAVGWVRVVVTPGYADPFGFESHVVPRWKYW